MHSDTTSFSINRRAYFPLVLTALVIAWALLYPWWFGETTTDFAQALAPPSSAHIFGTDHYGMDLAVRVAEGLRISILMALISAVVATAIGTVIGVTAALSPPSVDTVLMRTTDAVAAVPHILVTIIIAATWRGSLTAIVTAIALTHWTLVARLIRAQTITIRASRYVAQAYSFGASRWLVAREHFWLEARRQVIVSIALLTPHAVWHESVLSFLGLGLPPQRASLGTLIGDAQTDLLLGAWWTWLAPSAVLVAFTLLILATLRTLNTRESLTIPTAERGTEGTTDVGVDVESGQVDADNPLVIDAVSVRIPTTLEHESGWIHAATDVSLTVEAGRVLGLVGESGCGKSTLANVLAGVLSGDARITGHVWVDDGGEILDLVALPQHEWPRVRRQLVSVVPQGGAHCLNRVRTVRTHLEQVLKSRGLEADESARAKLLRRVHLDPAVENLYPHQLSGGMAQRINLALGIVGSPRVLVVDEPTAGLDPELAGDLWQLLRELVADGTAVLAITHAVEMAEIYADDIALMYAGRIVESGHAQHVARQPRSAYGRALRDARADAGLVAVPGSPPSLFNLDPHHSFTDRLGGEI
ncbi:MAG: ATP-binding cassette domain-containing protein [Actinomycetaceae bacterium]|nr:ATP-binding cassette domain-containing protein [Actinomycetaceae bacterium]